LQLNICPASSCLGPGRRWRGMSSRCGA
jgi:hypothetical protein